MQTAATQEAFWEVMSGQQDRERVGTQVEGSIQDESRTTTNVAHLGPTD